MWLTSSWRVSGVHYLIVGVAHILLASVRCTLPYRRCGSHPLGRVSGVHYLIVGVAHILWAGFRCTLPYRRCGSHPPGGSQVYITLSQVGLTSFWRESGVYYLIAGVAHILLAGVRCTLPYRRWGSHPPGGSQVYITLSQVWLTSSGRVSGVHYLIVGVAHILLAGVRCTLPYRRCGSHPPGGSQVYIILSQVWLTSSWTGFRCTLPYRRCDSHPPGGFQVYITLSQVGLTSSWTGFRCTLPYRRCGSHPPGGSQVYITLSQVGLTSSWTGFRCTLPYRRCGPHPPWRVSGVQIALAG